MVERVIRIDEAAGSNPAGSTKSVIIRTIMENREPKMEDSGEFSKYTYRDNSAGGKVVFECVAKNILEADKLYQEKTGKNPEKQDYVGCSIEKLETGKER